MSRPASASLVLVDRAVDADVARTIACTGYETGRAASAADTIGEALRLAAAWGPKLPRPGGGRTADLWSVLATLGSVDLTVARVVEPHLDALAILDEAGLGGTVAPTGATWGVYAAEGPGVRLTAAHMGSRWILDGHKPWCSLADRVSHALITAWVDDTTRGLFAVDLGASGVRPVTADGGWVSHGLPEVTSCGMDLSRVRAVPVGAPGWYLARPGFAWGGVGVAAVWFGAAVALARRVGRHVATRPADQVAQLHIGQLELALSTAREALASAATAADRHAESGGDGHAQPRAGGPANGLTSTDVVEEPPGLVAARTRSVVAESVETVLRVADHAMGPGPLATEAEHVQRVSDLRLYVRQHHAERDVAALGRQVLDAAGSGAPW